MNISILAHPSSAAGVPVCKLISHVCPQKHVCHESRCKCFPSVHACLKSQGKKVVMGISVNYLLLIHNLLINLNAGNVMAESQGQHEQSTVKPHKVWSKIEPHLNQISKHFIFLVKWSLIIWQSCKHIINMDES